MTSDDCNICATCAHYNISQGCCDKMLSSVFGCSYYERARCLSCFFYSSLNSACKKGLSTFTDFCQEYTQYVRTQKDKLSPQGVYDLCLALRDIPSSRIDIRYDEDASLLANASREKILMFVDKLFTMGVKKIIPEFFIEYIYTLEPFMYKESIICSDPLYEGCIAHIFEYPCGTQSIQIKVIIQNESIKIISFHQGVETLYQLQKTYTKSAILRTTGQFYSLCFGSTKMEGFMGELEVDTTVYRVDPESFIQEYRMHLQEAVQKIINAVHYLAEDLPPIKKLTTQGALSLGSLTSTKLAITDFCILHANLTMLTLSDSVTLQEAVLNAVTPLLSTEYIELLRASDSTLLNRLNLPLLQGGDQNGI